MVCRKISYFFFSFIFFFLFQRNTQIFALDKFFERAAGQFCLNSLHRLFSWLFDILYDFFDCMWVTQYCGCPHGQLDNKLWVLPSFENEPFVPQVYGQHGIAGVLLGSSIHKPCVLQHNMFRSIRCLPWFQTVSFKALLISLNNQVICTYV